MVFFLSSVITKTPDLLHHYYIVHLVCSIWRVELETAARSGLPVRHDCPTRCLSSLLIAPSEQMGRVGHSQGATAF